MPIALDGIRTCISGIRAHSASDCTTTAGSVCVCVCVLCMIHVVLLSAIILQSHFQILRNELDSFMHQQIQQLGEKRVTAILERVIRPHLGWLVLWGSVFGAVIGLVVQAVGLAPDY